jgi:hypothetical protein
MIFIGRLKPSLGTLVDQLAKDAAEISLRLAALPAGGLPNNPEALDSIELLARRILKEVAEIRTARIRKPGETSGMWRAMQPVSSLSGK